MADEESTPAKAAVKPGLFENKLFVVLIMVALQGGMAFAATRFLIAPVTTPPESETAGAEGDTEAAVSRQRGVLVSLDDMVVSLSSAGRPRYLKTNIAIETADAKTAEIVQNRMAQFRDAAIMDLSSHEPADLLSFEGKEAVKAEIKEALKDLLDKGEILNVYFSDFVVQ